MTKERCGRVRLLWTMDIMTEVSLTSLHTAPVPECIWLCAAHHLLCGGLAGDLVPGLQGAHAGGR